MTQLWQKAVVAVLFPLLGVSAGAADLTEAAVHSLLSGVDFAASRKSDSLLSRYFADNAIITQNIRSGSGSSNHQILRMTRQQYLEIMRETWLSVDEYQLVRRGTQIEIVGDQAVVRSTVIETVAYGGRRYSAHSTQTLTVELSGDQPRIVAAVANLTMP